MSKYAFADIITGKDIFTDQVKDKDIIGAKGYFANDLKTIVDAFDDNTFPESILEGTLETVSYAGRFKREEDGIYFNYFILKKEPKYVPFDLSKEEDRARLRGAWVRIKGSQLEHQIVGLAANVQIVFIPDVVSVEVKELLEGYEFIDGTPCGKLVEVE